MDSTRVVEGAHSTFSGSGNVIEPPEWPKVIAQNYFMDEIA